MSPTGLALVIALAPAVRAQDVGLQAATRLVGEGRFVEALAAAEAESEPLALAQGRLHVLHQAGDLRGALAAGRVGLESFPDDPWLLGQCANVALTLYDRELGSELLARLERVDPAAAAALAPYRDELVVADRQRQRALSRARWTVALGLGAALCGALLLARADA